MENNTETEIKLIIAKKDVKALVASPLVAKKTKKGSHKTVKLVNIYFDTRDLLLHQAGIAYRVRQNGKKYEATVKLSRAEAGGLSARQEYNVAVKNAKPNLSVFDESGLQVDFADILGDALEGSSGFGLSVVLLVVAFGIPLAFWYFGGERKQLKLK